MVLFSLGTIALIKSSFEKSFQYYKNVYLEKSLSLGFEEPDANFHQLSSLYPIFQNICQLCFKVCW